MIRILVFSMLAIGGGIWLVVLPFMGSALEIPGSLWKGSLLLVLGIAGFIIAIRNLNPGENDPGDSPEDSHE